jgi:amino-acid N-acetyltransferase
VSAQNVSAGDYLIRKSRITDIKVIHTLLASFAAKGLLLPRSLSELYDHLRDYSVVVNEKGELIGVVALHICWENLAEVRSLAVREDQQKRGLGRALVQHCLDEARSLGITRVFTLTYQEDFFKKLGFKPIDKSLLPHKIWADCVRCPKFPDCDEYALIMEL